MVLFDLRFVIFANIKYKFRRQHYTVKYDGTQ